MLRERFADLYRMPKERFAKFVKAALWEMAMRGEVKVIARPKPQPQPKEAAATPPKEAKPIRAGYPPYSPQAVKELCEANGYPKGTAAAFVDFVERKPNRGRGQWKERLYQFAYYYKKSGTFAHG